METLHVPVAIVGAGLAGIIAARTVRDAGIDHLIVEAGPVVGGRFATRQRGDATFDSGAQFFTTRSPEYTAFVDSLVAAGVAYEWCRGFNEVDGYPRFAARGGMGAAAAHLADGLNCRLSSPVVSVAPSAEGGNGERDGGGRWLLTAPALRVSCDRLLLTPPVPQIMAALSAGGALSCLDPALAAELAEMRYHRVLAVLATLDRPSAIPAPGALQLTEGAFSFVSDNAAKGISARPALTLHTAHALSAQRWDDPDDATLAYLLEEARRWIGEAQVVDAHLDRWMASGPLAARPERVLEAAPGLFLAGDAFGGPKVEGAYLSGVAAGQALLGRPGG